MNDLYLSFPQWQGAGFNEELFFGAKALRKSLEGVYSFQEVNVNPPRAIDIKNEIIGFTDIVDQLQSAIKLIDQNNPDRIFTIGGDCGTELAPIDYLNRKLKSEMAVIWIDAHADLNTPQSSPSKEFHGMPLRTLLGEGEKSILSFLDVPLLPKQVFILGCRALDSPESKYIQSKRINHYSISDITDNLSLIIRDISNQGFDQIYVHVDLDVLDPSEISSVKCPADGGISKKGLIQTIKVLKEHFKVIGGNVLEYTHSNDREIEDVKGIIHAVFP